MGPGAAWRLRPESRQALLSCKCGLEKLINVASSLKPHFGANLVKIKNILNQWQNYDFYTYELTPPGQSWFPAFDLITDVRAVAPSASFYLGCGIYSHHNYHFLTAESQAILWTECLCSSKFSCWNCNPPCDEIPWKRAWQSIPVFLPGEFHGQRSLAGSWGDRVGHQWATNSQCDGVKMWGCWEVIQS